MAQRPINPAWLIRQADELGYRNKGPGQPRNADLRRAVSVAYYALYHDVVLRVCTHQMPKCPDVERWSWSRLFTHKGTRRVCDVVSSSGPAPQHVAESVRHMRANQSLVDVAIAFVSLQQARFEADYDHAAEFTKPTTLSFVDQARDAMRKLSVIAGSADYGRFMALMAMHATPR